MKRISTIFLRVALFVIGAVILAVCVLLLPLLWNEIETAFPDYSFAAYVVFSALYIATIPFYVGLYKAWQLLSYIDDGRAFSKRSVNALWAIALCAAIISGVFFVTLPFFYIWGDLDDAPGVIIIGMVLVGAPAVVSVFAALLQRLISDAVELKSENDLTV